MPNWSTTTMTVCGSPKEIKKLRDTVQGKDGCMAFDFGKILPEPKELRGIITGHNVINGKGYGNWRRVGSDGMEEGISKEEANRLIEKYGACNLYDWNCENWGTKWNACEASLNHQDLKGGEIEYSFQTAWSFPEPVIAKLSSMFPGVKIVCETTNEGDNDLVHTIWENGVCTYHDAEELYYDDDGNQISKEDHDALYDRVKEEGK